MLYWEGKPCEAGKEKIIHAGLYAIVRAVTSIVNYSLEGRTSIKWWVSDQQDIGSVPNHSELPTYSR